MKTLIAIFLLISTQAFAASSPSGAGPWSRVLLWDSQNSLWYPRQAFEAFSSTSLNCNSSGAVSSAFDLESFSKFTIATSLASGAIGSAVFTLEKSFDGVTFFPSSETITGANFVDNISTAFRYVHLKVSTPQGAPCTANVTANAKQ